MSESGLRARLGGMSHESRSKRCSLRHPAPRVRAARVRDSSNPNPIHHYCAFCGAHPGEACRGLSRRLRRAHWVRRLAADNARAGIPPEPGEGCGDPVCESCPPPLYVDEPDPLAPAGLDDVEPYDFDCPDCGAEAAMGCSGDDLCLGRLRLYHRATRC